MPIVQPMFVLARVGQDVSATVTVPGNTATWLLTATLRDQLGPYGTVIATKTVGAGITNDAGAAESTITVTFDKADLTGLTPGPYIWSLKHTNAGENFDVVDWSTFLITPDDDSAYPQLTNLSELFAHLGFTEDVSIPDAKAYLQLVAAAERAIRDLCGRQFNYATHTDYPDTEWRRTILLNEYPVNPSGILVYYDRARAFDSSTLLTYGTDYILDHLDGTTGWSKTGLVQRLNGMWQGDYERSYGDQASHPIAGKGYVKVVYAAGFPLIPGDLKTAVHEIVADRISARRKGSALQSESGMNYSYSRGDWATEALKLVSVQEDPATVTPADNIVTVSDVPADLPVVVVGGHP